MIYNKDCVSVQVRSPHQKLPPHSIVPCSLSDAYLKVVNNFQDCLTRMHCAKNAPRKKDLLYKKRPTMGWRKADELYYALHLDWEMLMYPKCHRVHMDGLRLSLITYIKHCWRQLTQSVPSLQNWIDFSSMSSSSMSSSSCCLLQQISASELFRRQ